jgi:hypothetical protein
MKKVRKTRKFWRQLARKPKLEKKPLLTYNFTVLLLHRVFILYTPWVYFFGLINISECHLRRLGLYFYPVYFDWIKMFVHNTKECSVDIWKYNIMLPLLFFRYPWDVLHQDLKLTNLLTYWKINSYYTTVFLQLM